MSIITRGLPYGLITQGYGGQGVSVSEEFVLLALVAPSRTPSLAGFQSGMRVTAPSRRMTLATRMANLILSPLAPTPRFMELRRQEAWFDAEGEQKTLGLVATLAQCALTLRQGMLLTTLRPLPSLIYSRPVVVLDAKRGVDIQNEDLI